MWYIVFGKLYTLCDIVSSRTLCSNLHMARARVGNIVKKAPLTMGLDGKPGRHAKYALRDPVSIWLSVILDAPLPGKPFKHRSPHLRKNLFRFIKENAIPFEFDLNEKNTGMLRMIVFRWVKSAFDRGDALYWKGERFTQVKVDAEPPIQGEWEYDLSKEGLPRIFAEARFRTERSG